VLPVVLIDEPLVPVLLVPALVVPVALPVDPVPVALVLLDGAVLPGITCVSLDDDVCARAAPAPASATATTPDTSVRLNIEPMGHLRKVGQVAAGIAAAEWNHICKLSATVTP